MENTASLRGRRMNMADYEFSRMGIWVPSGTTIEDVTNSLYFRNYAHLVKPGAEIAVLSDDFTLDVSLRVLRSEPKTVTVRLIRNSSPAGEKPKDLPEGLSAEWGGPAHRWRIVEAGEVVEKGFGSREEAEAAALKRGGDG